MDRTRAMAEACVMTVSDFMGERNIEIPDRDDLTSDIEHVIRMYQRFEEEDRSGDKPVQAYRLRPDQRIDEWDAWSADTFPGWFIAGNGTLIEHGTADPAWTGAMEIVDSFDEFEALETIADGYLDREDREEMQKILHMAEAASHVDGNCWAVLNDLDKESDIYDIVRHVVAYFVREIICKEEMIAFCLGITNGQKYRYCEIRGCVQREWNICYYPVHQESDLTLCEGMYFNKDEQFHVYTEDHKTPVLVTAYGAISEDEYIDCIADEIGCSTEDIDLHM